MNTNTMETRIGFHLGNVLSLLADRYHKLQKMILEQIQNALDADATDIRVKIDLKERVFEISDNGSGASREEMELSFGELGKGRKSEKKFGRFGIGVISAFGKCEYFEFTSCARGKEKEGYLTWRFNTDEIKRESANVAIPCRQDSSYLYWPDESRTLPVQLRNRTTVSWRTKVKVVGLRKDARMCQIDLGGLRSEIISNFGSKMLESGAIIKIRYTNEKGESTKITDVVAEAYSGTPLAVYRTENDQVGNTTFRLYLSRSKAGGKREGVVNVNIKGNPFRVKAGMALTSTVPELLSKETLEDLTSGIFEGDIECEKLTLKPERDGFADDDALFGLCLAVDEWYKMVGIKHILETKNSKRESVFQETGLKAMQYIEALCRDPKYASLLTYLACGSIGRGHTPKSTIGDVNPAKSVDGGAKHEGKMIGSHKTKGDGQERKDHHPGTVGGPNGSPRKQVKGHSLGLRFEYAQLMSDQVYEFDIGTGVLTFNYSHTLWSMCEISKTALSRYQATVAQIVLVLLPYFGTSQYETQQEILLDFLEMQVRSIIDGEAFFTDRNIKRRTI